MGGGRARPCRVHSHGACDMEVWYSFFEMNVGQFVKCVVMELPVFSHTGGHAHLRNQVARQAGRSHTGPIS